MKTNRDKRLRFSIRKFNVGVASVAIAAFYMVGASAVSADTVSSSSGSSPDVVTTSSEESPTGQGDSDADPEPSPSAQESTAPQVEAPAASSTPVVPTSESSEPSSTATAVSTTEEVTPKAEEVAPKTEVKLKTTAIIYTVQYVDKATGKVLHKIPKAAQVTSSDDLPSLDVTEYSTAIPAGFLLAADQSQVITQTITKKAKNVITFYVEEDLDPTAGTNPEAQEGSSGLRSTFERNITQVAVPEGWYKSVSNLQLDDNARAAIEQAIRNANPHLDDADRIIVRPGGDAYVQFPSSSFRPGVTYSLGVGMNIVDNQFIGERYNFLQKDAVVAPHRVEVDDLANLTEENLQAIEANFREANAHHLVEADKVEVSPTGRLTVTKAATTSRPETIIIFDPSEVLLERELKKYHWLDFSDPKATVRDKNGQPLAEETAYDDNTRAPFTYKKLEVGTVYEREIYPGYTVRAEVTALKPYLPGDAALYGENADKNVYHKSNVDKYVGDSSEGIEFNQPGQEGYERRDRAGDIADVVIRAQDPNWSNLRNSGVSTGTNFTSIGALHQGANVGITFKVSSVIDGKEYPVNVLMADSEDGSRPEIVYFKTNGTPWEIRRTVQMKDGLQVGAPTTVQDLLDSYGSTRQKERRQYAENGFDPEQWVNKQADGTVATGEGTQLFGGVPTLVGQYAVPLVLSRDATEVSGYVNSFGRQFFQLAFVVEDLGDAPSTYGDAIHNISNHVYAANGGLETFNQPYLGSVKADPETPALEGRQNETATGDDGFNPTATADEGEGQLTGNEYKLENAGAGSTFKLIANLGEGNEQAFVRGWVDFDQSGTFEENEASDLVKVTANGEITLTYSKQLSEQPLGDYTNRIRIALAESDVTNPTGFARSGEVEDFIISYGNVTVEHKTVDGTVLKASAPVFEKNKKVDELDQEGNKGTKYTTAPLTGDNLVIDGKTYRLVRLAGAEDVTNNLVDKASAPAEGTLERHPKENYQLKADGTVEKAPQHVVYLYEEVKGNVTVEHVTDTGEVLKATTPVFPENQSLGTDYTTSKLTTDGKPEGTFVAEDGRVFKFTKMDDQSAPAAGDVTEATQHVKYVYTEVKGNVTVDYVDTNGKKLQPTYTDKENAPLNQTYDTAETTSEKPGLIKVGNKTYALAPANTYPVGTVGENNNLTTSTNPELGTAAVTGPVEEGTTKITYVYEEVTGSVIVKYVDDKGQTIPGVPNQTDTPVGTPVETPYNTTDQGMKPETVTSSDNKVYYFKEVAVDSVGKESGQVTKGETVITYVYEQAGSVLVNYKVKDATEINIIRPQAVDQRDAKPGTSYTTADQDMKPELITHGNKTYRLVPELTENQANESGRVEAGVTKEITYVYEEVVPKTGSVIVKYVDDAGNPIPGADDKTDKPAGTAVDTPYDTTDEGMKPTTITSTDGKTYTFKEVQADSVGKETGLVPNDTVVVTYVYNRPGSVEVNYKVEGSTDLNVIKAKVVDEDNVPAGTVYTTKDEDDKPTRIEHGGKVYEFVSVDPASAPEEGQVVAGETKQVTYVYREVAAPKTGSVIVKYVDDAGNPIPGAEDKTDKPAGTAVNTPYDTTDEGMKPTTITSTDGKTYTFKEVQADSVGKETGLVPNDTVVVTYVYNRPGSVEVNYKVEGSADLNVIKAKVVDEDNVPAGTVYTTKDENDKPSRIEHGGKVYEFVSVDPASAPEEGQVVAGETKQVTYVYREVAAPKTGSVIVKYVDDAGNPIPGAEDKTDKPAGTAVNTPYDTTDEGMKPTTITSTDGKTYTFKEVQADSVGKETGLVPNDTVVVTYVYNRPGSVEVNYKVEGSADLNVIKAKVVDEDNVPAGTVYTTKDEDDKPSRIEHGGKVYEFVSVDPASAPEEGQVVAGETKQVTYVYREVAAPKAGSVIVKYVDDAGNPIPGAEDKTDKPAGTAVNTPYDTTDEGMKPTTITSTDGKTYTFKEVQADSVGKETGLVPNDTVVVTYVYNRPGSVEVNYKVEGSADLNVIKAKVVDEDNVPAGTVYTTKDEDDKPSRIEHGGKVYEFVSVDPASAPEEGQVVAGETKQVTYVYREVAAPKTGSVIVKYVDDAGNPIPGADDKTDKPAGTAVNTPYDTTDEGMKPTTITSTDGKTYTFKEVQADSVGKETGLVPNDTVVVTYVYNRPGSVEVNYKVEGSTDLNVIKAKVVDEDNVPAGTVYTTKDEDDKPSRIEHGGKVYEFVSVDPASAPEEGQVVAGETKQVTYVYTEVKGNVTVEHVSDQNEVLIAEAPVKTQVSIGTDYTTENKERIVLTDGRVFTFTEHKSDSAPVAGKVDETPQKVVYIYTEVKGNVVVNYINEAGEVIKTQVEDTPSSSVGTEYKTTDNKPETITTEDGKVYEFIKVDEKSAPESGKVVEGTTAVTYVYREVKGNVVVTYKSTDGKEIKTPVVDTPDSSVGTSYTTTDNKPTLIEFDGKTYEIVPNLTEGTEDGKIVPGTTTVTYVYREVPKETPKGNVVVNYINEAGEVIKTQVEDTPSSSVGTEYKTTDNKPETITTEDGKVYEFIKVDEKSAPESGKVVEGTTAVTYVYREVKGNVVVTYKSTDGKEIKTPVVDTPDSSVGTSYTTTDNKPTLIEFDGKTYEIVPNLTEGTEDGKIVPGTTTVTYVYREVPKETPKGNVVVNYINEAGEVIKTQVEDTPSSSVGTEYKTTDNKPTEITTEDGKVYEFIKVDEKSAPESGKVVEGTTAVTYVYREVKGNVVVTYKSTDGKEIKTPVVDTPDSSVGTSYTTTDNKPTLIEFDGRTYEIVPNLTEGTEDGKIVPGTTTVTYVYREVPKETPKGNVVVNYINEAGEVIKTQVEDTPSSSVGTEYKTTDNKPETITTEDGKVYEFIKVDEKSAPESGKVVEGTTAVTYVYREVKGNVVVTYKSTDGKEIKTPVVDTPDSSVGTSYTTTDNKPTLIEFDGKTYEIVPNLTEGTEDGKIVPGTTTVTYVYREVPKETPKGNVVVNYINEAGEVIKTQVEDTPSSSVGTEYKTTDNKPETITTEDGKVYEFIKVDEKSAPESGKVVEGTTAVTYVYREVKGNVVVTYKSTDGKEIKTPVVDTPDSSVGTSYTTTDNKPTLIEFDGKTYEIVPNLTEGTEDGKIVPGTTTVTYVYREVPKETPKGNVVVNYINEAGEVIKTQVEDTPSSSVGTEYKTTDNKPETITTEDGKVYEFIKVDEKSAPESGKVVEGTTAVTYVYREVKGNVVVTYKSTDGKEIKTPVVDTPESSVKTPYDTTDNKPSTITTPDGKTYKIVPNYTDGKEQGTVVPGTTTVTYVYEEVKGDVIVHYVNEEGQTIKTDVIDTPRTSTGTAYNTTDNKPGVIITEDGTRYVLVPAKTQGSEDGQVVQGTTHVTYVYAKAANWIPLIPGVPTPPKVPYPFDPTNPDKPVDPGKPIVPGGDVPVIPYVPGYEPEIPLVPVDPEDPTKGYIPPIPENPGVDTPIPYKQVKGDVVVHYVNEAGETIKGDVVDTTSSPVGTAYNTTDNKPGVIVTEDGTRYVLVPAKTQGSEDGQVVQGTTHVTYVYAKAANWIPLIPGVPTPPKVPYPFDPTNPDKPVDPGKPIVPGGDVPVIPYVPGYEPEIPLVPVDPEDPTKGYIPPIPENPGVDTPIPYKQVKGDVVVHYVNEAGETIKGDVVDTTSSPVGTAYNTTDNKPGVIVTEDGTRYVLVPAKTQGSEDGQVVQGTTHVTYVYAKAANWIPLIPGVPTPPKVPYPFDPTNPDKPVDPGKPIVPGGDVPVIPYVPGYEPEIPLVPVDPEDPTKGYIPPIPENPGVDTPIPYKQVKGDVVVHYVNEAGETIKGDVVDTTSSPVGTAYNTTDNKPGVIVTEDGTRYVLVPAKTQGSEDGQVVQGTTHVTYVYAKAANWIPLIPGVPTPPKVPYPFDPTNPDKPVDPGKPIVPGGDVPVIPYVPGYEPEIPLVPVDPEDPTKGYIPPIPENPGVDTPIPYKQVKGDVVVHYVNEAGETIKGDVVDTTSSPVGTAYNTTDNKPGVIVTEDGTRYVLVPAKTQGSEDGQVVQGTTHVTYVYAKAANWIPLIPGVPTPPKVPYPFDPTNPDKPVDPGKPIVPGGDVPVIPYVPGYEPEIPLVPVDPEDPTKGYIPPIPENPGVDTPIPYKQVKGDVVVHYVNEAGETIKGDVVDTTSSPVGTAYNTTDNKPGVIVTEDGTRYVLVPAKTQGSEDGQVVQGTTHVTYVYAKAANWIPLIPGVPTPPKVPYPFDPTNPDKPVDPGKPIVPGGDVPVIPYVPGYEPEIPLVPVDPEDPTKGYIPPIPENPGVDTPIPYKQVKGDVVVHYVNEAGETIKGDVVDTTSSPVGTAYNTTDNKPGVIVTEDGTRYVLVPAKTQGSEDGQVVQGTTHVTYVYAKAANWIPLIPGVPTPPKVPYPFDPTNPDKPVDPGKPIVPGGDVPVIPYVPGYYPVNPKDSTPLVPVDPTDPSKGYIPPVPDFPGIDTPIPYIPVPPTPEQPKEPVTPTPEKPVQPVEPVTPRPVTPATPAKATLPNTGDASSAASLVGAGILLTTASLFSRRRKED